ncbi:MAG TPA: hypothetical protein VKA67_06920 [Verrucomicrobiae bacterium]|nr:hypothetical protein [Verrucomicrobiae bacterium]
MKTKSFSIIWLLVLTAVGSAAQSYTIDWYKIAGGGGTSTNGQYPVSGTIGQHDAGAPMSGDNYSLTGGFWSLIATVQTPGAPVLTITHSGSGIIVYWLSSSPSWTLQKNSDLTMTNWTDVGSVTVNGPTNSITVTSPTGNSFFRLKQ